MPARFATMERSDLDRLTILQMAALATIARWPGCGAVTLDKALRRRGIVCSFPGARDTALRLTELGLVVVAHEKSLHGRPTHSYAPTAAGFRVLAAARDALSEDGYSGPPSPDAARDGGPGALR